MTIEHFTNIGWQRRSLDTALSGAIALAMSACGGSTPPPEAPAAVPVASAASSADPTAGTPTPETAQNGSPAAATSPAPASPQPDTSLEKPTRPVRSIIESADTVFFLSYEESDVGKSSETTCTKESGGDPQKQSACMSKARKNLDGTGYRFKRKDPKAEVATCTILKRTDNNLSTLHKFRYKYGEETENSIVVKMEGKDDGPIKWEKIPAEFKVEVPNDYMIVVQDPKYGRLVYYAKAGIPGD